MPALLSASVFAPGGLSAEVRVENERVLSEKETAREYALDEQEMLCILRKQPRLVRAWLETAEHSEEEGRSVGALARSGACKLKRLVVGRRTRTQLAAALISQDVDIQKRALELEKVSVPAVIKEQIAANQLEKAVAGCVAYRAPSSIVQLLTETGSGTSAEIAAVQNMNSELRACYKGPIKLNAAEFRFKLANALANRILVAGSSYSGQSAMLGSGQ